MAGTCLFGAKKDPTPTAAPGQGKCLVTDSTAIDLAINAIYVEVQSPMKTDRLCFNFHE